jgi:hypothetical protein
MTTMMSLATTIRRGGWDHDGRPAVGNPSEATMSTDWGGLEERDGQFRVDGTTEKGRGGGDCVEAFELH